MTVHTLSLLILVVSSVFMEEALLIRSFEARFQLKGAAHH